MRLFRSASLVICSLLISASIAAQTPPPRDPQAVAILQHSLAAMGGVVPGDSVATGAIRLVAGSRIETGSIRILTRGLDQTAEHTDTQLGRRAVIYSRGLANEIEGAAVRRLQLELAVTSQSPDFPVGLLTATFRNASAGIQYVGLETLGGSAVHHIRFWNTFPAWRRSTHLAQFSLKHLWIDVASGLPRKVAYDRRAALGSAPRIAVEVSFSNYRNIGGVLYPLVIEKSLNGTPWATITVGSVVFNTGLSDADFPVQ